jgi:hypothetical protein
LLAPDYVILLRPKEVGEKYLNLVHLEYMDEPEADDLNSIIAG